MCLNVWHPPGIGLLQGPKGYGTHESIAVAKIADG